MHDEKRGGKKRLETGCGLAVVTGFKEARSFCRVETRRRWNGWNTYMRLG